MASQWIVKRGEKEQGPFTSPQLRQLASSGKLRTTDRIRKEGCDKFVPADKVKGLFDTPPAKLDPPKAEGTPLAVIPVAEVIEVVDEEQPIILESVREEDGSPDDFQDYENSYDEYPVVDYVEYEVPAASLKRSSRSDRARSESRGESRGGSRRSRSAKKPKKRKADDESGWEIEEGPWQSLMWCAISLAIGIGLFILIGPNGVTISGSGLIVWGFMLLNEIGGRTAILIFFIICAIGWLVTAVQKFSGR
jgi:hypothetical protein